MFNLYSLKDAENVEKALEIMKPILKPDNTIIEVETNSVGAIIFTIGAKKFPDLYKLSELTKPVSLGRRMEIVLNFQEGMNIEFFNVVNGKSIQINIIPTGEKQFQCYL